MQLVESQTIEFKQLWKDEYLKTICAFANTDGGVLYIGICDDGDITGVEKVNSLLEILPNKIGRFLSDSELLTSDIVEGNLFEQLEKIIEILRTKYLHSYISYDGLNRVETLEYPYEAVREIIINALIHRDYSDTTVLQIRVYDNKIVFTNGATLSHEVPIEKFKVDHLSKPYNPLIANIFYKAGFVESWGKGTNNIVEDCIKMQLPEPDYKYTQHAVQVFLYKATLKTTPKTTKERLVEFIKEDSYITRELLAEKLGITINGVKQHILNLKKDNILKRVGGRKDGFWEIEDE